jgi:hypothetical protein
LVEATPTVFLVLTRQTIISSAQLKLSLDNTWQLGHLDQEDLAPQLRILVKRAQAGRQLIARAS